MYSNFTGRNNRALSQATPVLLKMSLKCPFGRSIDVVGSLFLPQAGNKSSVEIFQKVKLGLALFYPQDNMDTVRAPKAQCLTSLAIHYRVTAEDLLFVSSPGDSGHYLV